MAPTEESAQPVKPSKMRVELEEGPASIAVRLRQRQWAGGCFLMLWLCGWTVGCVLLAGEVWKRPEVFMIAFAIPFWASWFFVAAILMSMFFQFEELTLDESGLTYANSIIIPFGKKIIPLAELKHFECSATTNYSENDSPKFYVELVTVGRPLTMFSNLTDDERGWLTWRLNDALSGLRPLENAVAGEDDASTRSDQVAIEIPSDCTWQCVDSYDGTTFIQRGRLVLSAFFGTLFVCLFWNGIVSVFVMNLRGFAPGGPRIFGGEWWAMCVFLIPFEVIGLGMFTAFLITVLEPFRHTSWTIDRDEIVYRISWFGIGRRRRYASDSVERVDLRIQQPESPTSTFTMSDFNRTTSTRTVRLTLVDRNNTEVVSIGGITEGEARWMKNLLRRDHPQWFRSA